MTGHLSLTDGRTVPVRNGLVIGRIAECDLVIDDGKASRRHARIVVEGGVVEIEDLGSSNGTLLNGKPVTRRLLRPGDEVQIGKTVITYREGGQPAAKGPSLGAAVSAASALDDDNDLFGSSAPTQVAAKVPPPPPPPPPPAPSPPPAPPAARPAVVEFADEIVEVRKPPAATAPSPAASSQPVAGGQVAARQQGVLQFHKQEAKGGMLGDDLAQMSGGVRSLVYAIVLALAIGLGWLVMHLVR